MSAARVEQWIKSSRMWMLEKQISYTLLLMNEPVEKTLRDFLRVRKTIMR